MQDARLVDRVSDVATGQIVAHDATSLLQGNSHFKVNAARDMHETETCKLQVAAVLSGHCLRVARASDQARIDRFHDVAIIAFVA